MRIGHGYDAHRLIPGRPCILCGVEIPSPVGPLGHSDADVPVHALMDAILGAAALGDIGRWFPDSDERYRGARSLDLLDTVLGLIRDRGWRVGNADVTIIAQVPRLAPYMDRMRDTLAESLGVPPENVNVKATTEEKMGFTGSGEGLAAHAVVLLEDV